MIAALYNLVIFPLLFSAFWIASLFNPKIKEGFRLRRHRAWLLKTFDQNSSAPLIWFHVASGEFEYAKPVIRALKRNSSVCILVTYFSPSVLKSLQQCHDVDYFCPMPWDTPWHWQSFLKFYRPAALAIARTDTWPQMIWQANRAKIPSILFSATLPKQSARYASFFGRLLYGSVVEKLSRVSAVTEEDASHFKDLFPDIDAVIDGDTRFDQVLFRLEERRPTFLDNQPYVTQKKLVFAAGSTWPQDEAVLIPALMTLKSEPILTFLAPHEPTSDHLEELEDKIKEAGLTSIRYTELQKQKFSNQQVVIIDVVGVLAELYRMAHVSFVGGSFKKSVHSVMEPAACGSTAVFGPLHYNSREALALKRERLAFEIQSSEELAEILKSYVHTGVSENEMRKAKTFDFVQKSAGVSSKVAAWIQSHLNA